MITKTTTVYEALQERKLLEKRVKKVLECANTTPFVTYGSEVDETIGGISKKDAISLIESNFKSIDHLIKNIAEYDAAIMQSNAVTKVTIDNKEYTVAQAIARHQSIDTEQEFIQTLIKQYSTVKKNVDTHNSSIKDPVKVADFIKNVIGDSKKDENLIKSTTDTYMKNNLWVIVDPNKLGATLEDKMNDLNSFKEKFHFILTQSNAITTIDINLEN